MNACKGRDSSKTNNNKKLISESHRFAETQPQPRALSSAVHQKPDSLQVGP